MKKNVDNKVIYNVLSDEDIAFILDQKDKTERSEVVPDVGHRAWHISLPQNILDKFSRHAEEVAKEPLDLVAYQFARYENMKDKDNDIVPVLFPHTDEVFGEPRFTFDYQINSNTSWDIIVDNWETINGYMLNDNSAVTFSGTHQVHWRPKKKFLDDEFIEMIFLHYRPKNFSSFDLEHYNMVRKRAKQNYEIWKLQEGPNGNGSEDDLLRQEKRYEPKDKI